MMRFASTRARLLRCRHYYLSPLQHHHHSQQYRSISSSQAIWNRTKEWSRRTTERFKERGQVAAKRAWRSTQEASQSLAHRMTAVTKSALHQSFSATRDFATRQMQSAKKSTLNSVSSAKKSLTDAAGSSVNAGKALMNDSIQRVSSSIEETGRSTVRRFWWWSLGAIFVLGLAMSIPREIRLALENRQQRLDQKKNEEQ